jgi:hypothetical protein
MFSSKHSASQRDSQFDVCVFFLTQTGMQDMFFHQTFFSFKHQQWRFDLLLLLASLLFTFASL